MEEKVEKGEIKNRKKSFKNKNTIGISIIIVGVLLLLIGGLVIFSELNQSSNKKNNSNEELKPLSTLMKITEDYSGEFWQYKEKIKTITFETKIDIPSDIVESWDVSENKDGLVMAYIKENESQSGYYDLFIQGNEKIYANQDSSYLFSHFIVIEDISNMSALDTSKVIDMHNMFELTGIYSANFILDLGDNFVTTNVTDMSKMFFGVRSYELDLGDKFDTSKVTNMADMFYGIAVDGLYLGSKFNTSSVTNMSKMFAYASTNSTVFTLDLGDKFDTANVTVMNSMFEQAGLNSSMFMIDCSRWNVDKVTEYSNFNQGVESKVIAPNFK